MIYDFSYLNPTTIHFGKKAMEYLSEELLKYGKNILFLYGGGSIKKIGVYDEVIKALKATSKNVFECPGVMPNPTYDKVLEGAKMCRDNNIDLILAVGGGSVIDCAKAISASAYAKDDPWQRFYINFEPVTERVIPIGDILTMAGTGSECNGGAVITNTATKQKIGRVFPIELYPRFAILNPEYTYSVSEYQMLSGIFDIFSHLMEQYFSNEDDNVSDYLLEGLMKSLIVVTPLALKDPRNYEARSNIMWAASIALNGIVGVSKLQDWEVHGIEHQISAYTNCAHGIGLASISVNYYKAEYKYGLAKFVRFAINVFNVNPKEKSDDEIALLGLDALDKFIRDNKMYYPLKELGVTEEMLKDIAYSAEEGGGYHHFTHKEILQLLKKSL